MDKQILLMTVWEDENTHFEQKGTELNGHLPNPLPEHRGWRLKSAFSQPYKEKCISDVVRIGSTIIFYLNQLWKAKFSILCDVIFLVRLQEKFEIGSSTKSWSGIWSAVKRNDSRRFVLELFARACIRQGMWIVSFYHSNSKLYKFNLVHIDTRLGVLWKRTLCRIWSRYCPVATKGRKEEQRRW